MRIKRVIDRLFFNRNLLAYVRGMRHKGRYQGHKGKKKLFFLLAPSYGNIGDQAIVEATLRFYQDYFSEYEIVKVDFDETFQSLYAVKNAWEDGDFIVLQGGGNIGTFYPEAEKSRRFICSIFKDRKIVSMPQSIFFEDSGRGKRELQKSRRAYARCNAFLVARDAYSYQVLEQDLKVKSRFLCPDIVFYLSKKICPVKSGRTMITVCLRSDREQNERVEKASMIHELKKRHGEVFIYDTCVDRRINDDMRMEEIDSLLYAFSLSEWVVTDRLHGMVLAALAGTPCIVLGSMDTKVLGAYQWISDLPFLHFCESYDTKAILEGMERTQGRIDLQGYWGEFCAEYFDRLSGEVKSYLER